MDVWKNLQIIKTGIGMIPANMAVLKKLKRKHEKHTGDHKILISNLW